MENSAVLGLSILFQLATLVLALKLILVTGKRRAWLFIAAALSLMIAGRSIVWYACLVSPNVCPFASTQLERWMNLLISALLLAGVAWISPLFLSVRTAEDNLRKSEEKYRSLFQDSRDTVFQSTRDGRFVELNPSGLELFGLSRDEVVPLDVRDVYVNPADRLRLQKEIEEKRSVQDFEVKFRKRNGNQMDCLMTATLVCDHSGNILGYRGIIRNVTYRKRAEEALRESEAKYRELVQNANSIILRVDTEGFITFFNEFAQSFFGYSEQEIVGRNVLGTIVPDTPKARDDLTTMILGIIEERSGHHCVEYESVRRNGEKVRIAWTNRIIHGDDGRPRGILCIGNDVTQQKQLEAQYRQSQKMEAIGRLAGGIAHDFNNLLTIILGYSEILVYQARYHPLVSEAAEEIKGAAERSSALVRQLLTFSRQQMLAPKVLNANTIVIETEKMLRRLIGENIRLTTSLGQNIWKIKADPGQIEQVVINLAINARDAMPDGGTFSIETSNVTLERENAIRHLNLTPGQYVKITFKDTGVGMEEETLSRVFDPFFTTKEPGKGTGLGLATVYGIVTQSEGNIEVSSVRGKGTTFSVYLPGFDEDSPSVAAPPDPVCTGPGVETILLVEDDDGLRKIIRRILNDNGYGVIEASKGEEALSIAERSREAIHLMVTDLVLPGMSGQTLATRIAVSCPGIRVLFISGYMGESSDGQRSMATATDFLQKPFSPPAFLQRVRALLNFSLEESQSPPGTLPPSP